MPEQSVHPPTEPTVPVRVDPPEPGESKAATPSDDAEKSRRSNRSIVVSLIALAAVLAGTFIFAGRSDESSGEPDAGHARTGVFKGSVPAEVAKFGEWAGREIDYAADFSARGTWEEIAYPNYLLDIWKDSGYRMVYGVAMLPLQDESATMAAGARGEYDHHFRTLAQNLVDHGQGDSILRLGWEFNLRESRWHPDSRENFISYWQHIVKAMRSVPGPRSSSSTGIPTSGERPTTRVSTFRVGTTWTTSVSTSTTSPGPPARTRFRRGVTRPASRPGGRSPGTTGSTALSLRTYADFARSMGKPMSLPEWGSGSGPMGTAVVTTPTSSSR